MKKILGTGGHSLYGVLLIFSRVFQAGAFLCTQRYMTYYVQERLQDLGAKDYQLFFMVVYALSIFLAIPGGLFGDLLKRHQLVGIIGGILQILGGIALIFVSGLTPILAALILIAIGNGLFISNVLALFSKYYADRRLLIGAASTLLFVGIFIVYGLFNIVFSYALSEENNLPLFLMVVVMNVISLIPIAISNGAKEIKPEPRAPFSSTWWIILSIFFLVPILAGVCDFFHVAQLVFYTSFHGASEFPWGHLTRVGVFLTFGVALIVFWSFFYVSAYLRLMIGAIVASMSFFFLFQFGDGGNMVVTMIAEGMMAIAEMLIIPVLIEMIAKYFPIRFLATGMALGLLALLLINQGVQVVNTYFLKIDKTAFLYLNLAMMLVVAGASFLIFYLGRNAKVDTMDF